MCHQEGKIYLFTKAHLILATDLLNKQDPVRVYLQYVYSPVYILLGFLLPALTVAQPIPVLMVIWPEGHS